VNILSSIKATPPDGHWLDVAAKIYAKFCS